jgi:hypothetical protein
MEEQMRAYYRDVAGAQRASANQNRVKSQLVESHLPLEGGRDAVLERLRALAASRDHRRGPAGWIDAMETEDEHLFVLRAHGEDDDVVRLFVDTLDRRYWIVHSLDKSRLVRPRMESLPAQLGRGFDNVWFSIAMLDATRRFGRRRGMKIQFTDYLATPPEHDEPEGESLKITLKSARTDSLLEFLRHGWKTPFASRVGISASLVRAVDPEQETSGQFVLEDIYYNGHFSARGTSARRHLEVVTSMRDQYGALVRRLEERAAVSWAGGSPSGEVLLVPLRRPDLDVGRLVERLSGGRPPFNFWGVPVVLREGHVRVDLVDLHHGNAGRTLTVEVTRDWLRLVLPKGACGNAVTRLLSNLQRGVDSAASLLAADEVLA